MVRLVRHFFYIGIGKGRCNLKTDVKKVPDRPDQLIAARRPKDGLIGRVAAKSNGSILGYWSYRAQNGHLGCGPSPLD